MGQITWKSLKKSLYNCRTCSIIVTFLCFLQFQCDSGKIELDIENKDSQSTGLNTSCSLICLYCVGIVVFNILQKTFLWLVLPNKTFRLVSLAFFSWPDQFSAFKEETYCYIIQILDGIITEMVQPLRPLHPAMDDETWQKATESGH